MQLEWWNKSKKKQENSAKSRFGIWHVCYTQLASVLSAVSAGTGISSFTSSQTHEISEQIRQTLKDFNPYPASF